MVVVSTGGQGDAEFSTLPDKTGQVTISLQQQSPSSRFLAAVAQGAPSTSGDLTIVDPSGSIFAQCKGARIMTRAEITRGINAGDNTNDWVFVCEELIYTGTPDGINADIATFTSAAGSLAT